jgi:CoA-transferase family III
MIARLHAMLAERLALFGLAPGDLLERDAPGGLGEPGLVSANGSCRLLAARDGWIALNLARDADRETVPALTHGEQLVVAAASSTALEFRDRAIELQMPVAFAGESQPQLLAASGGNAVPRRVVDLSALWAGPLCTGLLARAGAEVLRIESQGRPDPTPAASPRLDAFLNGAKVRLPLDLRSAEGRARLIAEVAQADALVTSARPVALARLGLEPERFPNLTWVAITAHGFTGPGALRVGFGDDCAVAGGLLDWRGTQPRFLGDALADPLTGLEAALAILAGQRGLIDMAMAKVAAAYAELLS